MSFNTYVGTTPKGLRIYECYTIKNILIQKKDAKAVYVECAQRTFPWKNMYLDIDCIVFKEASLHSKAPFLTKPSFDGVSCLGQTVLTASGDRVGVVYDARLEDHTWYVSHILIRDTPFFGPRRQYLVSRKHIIDIGPRGIIIEDIFDADEIYSKGSFILGNTSS